MFEIIYSDANRNYIVYIHSQENCTPLKYKSLLFGDSILFSYSRYYI